MVPERSTQSTELLLTLTVVLPPDDAIAAAMTMKMPMTARKRENQIPASAPRNEMRKFFILVSCDRLIALKLYKSTTSRRQ